jgi:hypothetical protein
MFPEQLKKILNFVKKTGDRVVIFDASAPDDSFVVMDFDSYSQSGNEGITKAVNSEIIGKNTVSEPDLKVPEEKAKNLTEEDLTDKINREISMWKNRDDLSFSTEENKPKKAWSIPPQVKEKAQGVE